jgi:hypothetical protein
MTRRSTHDTRTDRSKILFDTQISSIFYGNKLINAIREADPYSQVDKASAVMQETYLDHDISDIVTETAEIYHH